MPIRHERSAPERDDALDASLVRALQADGRASIHELARAVGASRDVVSRRLSTLIGRDGLRVVAALDPGFAGLNVLIHGLVEVDGPARPVAQRIAELPDTVFVSLVAGGSSLVFESRHGDGDELSATLTAIRALPGVRRVRVTTYDALLKEFITAASVTDVRLDLLDHDLIAALRDAVPVPLVLHGSSGVADAELRRAVAGGIAKVNIGTALNIACTTAIRNLLDHDPAMVDPRKYIGPARDAMAKAVVHFASLFAAPAQMTGAK